jgi:cell division protein FtsL
MTILAIMLRVRRFRVRTLLVLIVFSAISLGWFVHERRRRLADDSGNFFSHEEQAARLSFEESAALMVAREAEQKAAEGGSDAARWASEAATARLRASAAGKGKREYEWRASLKRTRW